MSMEAGCSVEILKWLAMRSAARSIRESAVMSQGQLCGFVTILSNRAGGWFLMRRVVAALLLLISTEKSSGRSSISTSIWALVSDTSWDRAGQWLWSIVTSIFQTLIWEKRTSGLTPTDRFWEFRFSFNKFRGTWTLDRSHY